MSPYLVIINSGTRLTDEQENRLTGTFGAEPQNADYGQS
jgi:hypothetical protein